MTVDTWLLSYGVSTRRRAQTQLRPPWTASQRDSGANSTRRYHRSGDGIGRERRERIAPVFQYPPQIRRLLYTTNAIESLNRQLRKIIKIIKIIKTRGHFPNDEAALKLLYLALRNATATWRKGSRDWTQAMPHLALLFGDRFVGDV